MLELIFTSVAYHSHTIAATFLKIYPIKWKRNVNPQKITTDEMKNVIHDNLFALG